VIVDETMQVRFVQVYRSLCPDIDEVITFLKGL
jgi:hypothetical protein